jgi:S-adenosyl methyltransferase
MTPNRIVALTNEKDHEFPQFNTGQPHSARVYDYWLGGKDNYAADRELAERSLEAAPELRDIARENRKFLQRAVQALADLGIRQFLDIGTGIPTRGNTHQVAQSVVPEARVAYVDNDPIVAAHSRALLAGTPEGRIAVIQEDLRRPAVILGNPEVRETLDFAEPVAIMLVSVLQFIPDSDDPAGIVARLCAAAVPGSCLVISHPTNDFRAEAVGKVQASYNQAKVTATARSKAQIARFFGDLELLDPGLERIPLWRPEEPPPSDLDRIWMYGGVGVKRRG